jgi:arsenate reductase
MKKTILFLCTHNSARSQMAEASTNKFLGDIYTAYSAGTEKTKLNPYVKKAMEEIGIDMSAHYSKTAEQFLDKEIDVVVTVCDSAKEACPFFPGAKTYIHKSFTDPSSMTGTEEEIMAGVRKVRDEIKVWIESLREDDFATKGNVFSVSPSQM